MESVLSQEVQGLEYIVVDGQSADDTVAILRSRLDASPGAFLLLSEPARGHADAINKGIQSSRGEIVGWLNSDDVYIPGGLRTVADFFAAHPAVDVLYGEAFFLNEAGERIGVYPTAPWNPGLLRDRCIISQPSAFVRRRVFERHGLLDNTYRANDYELWVRLAKAGARFAHIREYLSATRLHSQCATVQLKVKCCEDAAAILLKHHGKVSGSCLSRLATAQARQDFGSGLPRAAYLTAKARRLKAASRRWNRSVSLPDLMKASYWQVLGLCAGAGLPAPLTREERDTMSGRLW